MKIYFVKQGDSISSIASKYGVEESAILRLNGLDPGEVPAPGSKLKIPVLSVAIDQRGEPKPKEKVQKPETAQKPAEMESKKDKKEKLTAEKPIQQPVQVPVQKPSVTEPAAKQEAVKEKKEAAKETKQKETQQSAQAKDLYLPFPSPALEAGSFYDWPNMAAEEVKSETSQVPWGMPYPQMNALLQYEPSPTANVQMSANAPSLPAEAQSLANAQLQAANAPGPQANMQLHAGNVPYPSATMGMATAKPCGCGSGSAFAAANAPMGMPGGSWMPMGNYPGGYLSPTGALSASPYGGNQMHVPVSTLANMMSSPGTMPAMPNMSANMMPNVAPNMSANMIPNVAPNMSANMMPNVAPNMSASMMPNVAPNMTANMMPYATANTMPNMMPNMSAAANMSPTENAKTGSSAQPKAKLHDTADDSGESPDGSDKTGGAATSKKARTKAKKRQGQAKIKQLTGRQLQTQQKRKKTAQQPWIQYPLG